MRKLRVLFVTSLLISVAASANAITFTGTYQGISGQVVNVTVNSATYNVWGGRIEWGRTYISPALPADTAYTYCVDIASAVISPGTFTFSTTGNPGSPLPAGITAASLQNAGFLLQQFNSWAVDADHRAALQLGIWRVAYGNLTFNSVPANVQNLFNSLSAATSGFTTFSTTESAGLWRPLDPANNQYQIEYIPGGAGEGDPVPEPFTMGLVAAAALAALKRRTIKKA